MSKSRCIWLWTILFMLLKSNILSQEISTPIQEILHLHEQAFLESNGLSGISEYLRKASKDSGRIEKMELRTETDEWMPERQEYMFRTSFKSKDEQKSERRLLNTWNELLVAERKEDKAEYMKDLFSDVINLLDISRELDLQEEVRQVLYDKKSIFHQQIEFGQTPDAIDLLEIDDDLLDNEIDLNNLKIEKSILTTRLTGSKENKSISFEDWAEVKILMANIESSGQSGRWDDIVSPEAIKLKQSEIALEKEKAEGNRLLDFIQMKYANRGDTRDGSQLSLGIGVIIPSGHVNKTNINEATIDLYLENKKYQDDLVDRERRLSEAHLELEASMKKWKTLNEKIEELGLDQMLVDLSKSPKIDPFTLLKVKSMMLKRQLDLLDAEKSIYEDYLDLSYLNGTLHNESAYTLFLN